MRDNESYALTIKMCVLGGISCFREGKRKRKRKSVTACLVLSETDCETENIICDVNKMGFVFSLSSILILSWDQKNRVPKINVKDKVYFI